MSIAVGSENIWCIGEIYKNYFMFLPTDLSILENGKYIPKVGDMMYEITKDPTGMPGDIICQIDDGGYTEYNTVIGVVDDNTIYVENPYTGIQLRFGRVKHDGNLYAWTVKDGYKCVPSTLYTSQEIPEGGDCMYNENGILYSNWDININNGFAPDGISEYDSTNNEIILSGMEKI